MAEILGTLVDTPRAESPVKLPSNQLDGGAIKQIRMDTAEFAAAPVGDYITLHKQGIPWETVISPDSKVYYDALGTGVTVSYGDVTYPAGLGAAAAASSAGSRALLASVDIANYGKPLWQMLGYASLTAAKLVGKTAVLRATVVAASTTATGTVSWDIKGITK